jgi:hypothetical protein
VTRDQRRSASSRSNRRPSPRHCRRSFAHAPSTSFGRRACLLDGRRHRVTPNVSGRLAHHAARPLGCQLQLAARSGDKGRSSRPIAGPPKRPETPPALGRRGASPCPARTLPAESERGRIAARVVRRLTAPSRSVLGGAVRVRKGFGLLHDLSRLIKRGLSGSVPPTLGTLATERSPRRTGIAEHDFRGCSVEPLLREDPVEKSNGRKLSESFHGDCYARRPFFY